MINEYELSPRVILDRANLLTKKLKL